MTRRKPKIKNSVSAVFRTLGLSDIAAGRPISDDQAQQLAQMTEAEVYAIRGVDERLLRMVNCELRDRRLSLVRAIGKNVLPSLERFESVADVKRRAPHVAVQQLENPLYSFDHPDGEGGNRRKVPTAISMRESPAIWMHCHDQISDSQLKASSWIRRNHEAAGMGGIKAMDTTKEPVDGGMITDGMTDRKLAAANALAELTEQKILTGIEYSLLIKVCGECQWLKDLGPASKRGRLNLAVQFRAALDKVAVHCGYMTKPHTNTGS